MLLTTFIVNSTSAAGDPFTGDGLCDTAHDPQATPPVPPSGICTLAGAVASANGNPGVDTIAFSIPSAGVPTINLSAAPGSPSSLAAFEPVMVDGTTQPGAGMVELRSPVGVLSLLVGSDGSTVRGLAINNSGGGIGILSDNNTIVGNRIGTNPAGTQVMGNAGNGVAIFGSNNTIGGTTAQDRNIISGNGAGISIVRQAPLTGGGNVIQGNYIGTDITGTVSDPDGIPGNGDEFGNGIGVFVNDAANNVIRDNVIVASTGINAFIGHGVHIANANATGNVVRGNKIGVDASGAAILANAGDGVWIESASNNTVGGMTPAERNIISGNSGDGVTIFGNTALPSASNNVVAGNYIGVAADGLADLGNGSRGVHIGSNATNNIVGGDSDAARNVISGNDADGVLIASQHAAGNVLKGNYIGTDAEGNVSDPMSLLGNAGAGVLIQDAVDNVVGGQPDAGQGPPGNTIAGNGLDGVRILGDDATGNVIQGNSIFGNEGLGIDLGGDGVTANDLFDADRSPNRFQNYPVLTAVFDQEGATTIAGGLSSRIGTQYRIEVFSSEMADPTEFGEGMTFLGAAEVTTDGIGNANFRLSLPSAFSANFFYTATATDLTTNDTSEFSPVYAPIIVNSTGDEFDSDTGDLRCDTGNTTPTGAPECTLRAAIQTANRRLGLDFIAFDIPSTPSVIQPTRELPTVSEMVIIDGTTQPGSANVPIVRVNGANAGDVTGVRIDSEGVEIRGLVIEAFRRTGLGNLADDVTLSNMEIVNNGWNGVLAPNGSVTFTGRAKVSDNGWLVRQEEPVKCLDQFPPEYIGIWAQKDVKAEDIEVMNNCGFGIFAREDIELGSASVINNADSGVFAFHNITLDGAGHNVSDNGGLGIGTTNGFVHISGTARVNNNGHDLAANSAVGKCVVGGGPGGIDAEKEVTADNVEVSGNCGDGISSFRSSVELKNATILDNIGKGIRASQNILLAGVSHNISDNDGLGLFTGNGFVQITGNATINNNGFPDDPFFGCFGGIGSSDDIIAEDITVSGNCGTGIDSYASVQLGNTTVLSNKGQGISAGGNITLTGTNHRISSNHREGLAAPDGLIDVNGTVEVNNNESDGIFASSVQLETGEVCNNRGFGIRQNGGTINIGSVNILCGNGDGPMGFLDPDGTPIPVTPSPAAGFSGDTVDNPAPGQTPSGVTFPFGFFGFTLGTTGDAGGSGEDPATSGGSATVTILLPPEKRVNSYYKFGPTPDDSAPHFYEFLFDGTTGAEIFSDRIILHFVDGRRGDNDLTVNGQIVDPGAPAFIELDGPRAFVTGNRLWYIAALGEANDVVVTADSRATIMDAPDVTITAGEGCTGGGVPAAPANCDLTGIAGVHIQLDDTDDTASLGGFDLPVVIDGGSGDDTLTLTGSGVTLDLTAPGDGLIQAVETLDISGSGDNTLTLNTEEVVDISPTTDTLIVRHDRGDTVNYGAGWMVNPPSLFNGEFRHILQGGAATIQVANTTPWQNPYMPLDANRDGQVSPIDALLPINSLNAKGSRPLTVPTSASTLPEFYLDTNGDNFNSPIDVLLVFNLLNDPVRRGEGELLAALVDLTCVDALVNTRVASVADQHDEDVIASQGFVAITVRPAKARRVGQDEIPTQSKRLAADTEDSDLLDAIDAFFGELGLGTPG